MNRTLSTDAPQPSVLMRLVEHHAFTRTIVALIALSAVLLGLETLRGLPASLREWLTDVNRLILGIFVVELALRIAAHGRAFFRDPWSVFDLVVVGAALIPGSNAMQMLRALRIIRALRLVSAVPSLRRVVDGLVAAMPGIASIAVLLVLLLYVAAVMATLLFRDVAPEFFGHLGLSLFSLFQIMTLEAWPDIAREVMASEPWAWVFFVGYILVATYTMLNLVIGVVVSAIQSRIGDESNGEGEDQPGAPGETKLAQEVAKLRREIASLSAELRRRG